MIAVERADPRATGPADLLTQSHALMASLFPAEANHYLDIDALCADHIRFFAARDGDRVVGTGALALLDGYGEVKSMFTHPDVRGRGAGSAILRMIEDVARDEGVTILRLETGTGLDAAHKLYERSGFVQRGPFGTYTESPHSLFYEKVLQ